MRTDLEMDGAHSVENRPRCGGSAVIDAPSTLMCSADGRSTSVARIARRMTLLLATTATAGCAGAPSFMEPAGEGARVLARLGWWLLAVACVVVVIVAVLVVVGTLRGSPARDLERHGQGVRWIVIGGVAIPAVVLVAAFAFSVAAIARLAPLKDPRAMTVEVVAHRWWWEVRYLNAGQGAVVTDANEVHVPVGVPVRIRLASADVAHSFWAPQIAGKTDLIPGQVNETWVRATRPGTFRGMCAEFCGMQHAHMDFQLVALPPADFARWMDHLRAPAAEPTDALAAEGRNAFEAGPCASCHTVRGTPAGGAVGPDLTHVGSRAMLAAGSIANTPRNLSAWIENAQALKPGAAMPAIAMSPRERSALVAYLRSLK